LIFHINKGMDVFCSYFFLADLVTKVLLESNNLKLRSCGFFPIFYYVFFMISSGEFFYHPLKYTRQCLNIFFMLQKKISLNYLGGSPVVRVWDQDVCSLCGLRFEPCGCLNDSHWRLTWSLTSRPVELVEVRVNWPGHYVKLKK